MSRFAFVFAILISSFIGRAQTTLPSSRDHAALVQRPDPAITRAVIISIDGLRPDVLLRANTPVLHQLFHDGSFSFWARTTAVAITLPSHTSMLTGCTPEHHKVTWNTDLPNGQVIYPAVPTLFELAHRAGYTTAMAAGKSKFSTLAKPGTLDWSFVPSGTKIEDPEVANEAVAIILAHQPQVLFVHFPSDDNVGHAKGWGTPAQLAAVERADACVGQVLDALKQAKVLDSTFVLVTADHGGAGRSHGHDDPRSRHIPWIAVGPGIKKDLDLTTYPQLTINTEDTFATVCWLLGIHVDPKSIDGKPITEILQRTELLHSADLSK